MVSQVQDFLTVNACTPLSKTAMGPGHLVRTSPRICMRACSKETSTSFCRGSWKTHRQTSGSSLPEWFALSSTCVALVHGNKRAWPIRSTTCAKTPAYGNPRSKGLFSTRARGTFPLCPWVPCRRQAGRFCVRHCRQRQIGVRPAARMFQALGACLSLVCPRRSWWISLSRLGTQSQSHFPPFPTSHIRPLLQSTALHQR
mmetsp:Transcript_132481/g.369350  ORF Transcript_132481/g.369350 Transcript_132481/m.369350 type:complete len:200 (-) Transcript_132481:90-689(-)